MADVSNRALSNLMQTPLSRRDLFLLGSAGLLSAALMKPAAFDRVINPQALLDLPRRISVPLAIGYWWRGESNSTAPAGTDRVVDAGRLRSGDVRLAREGARLRILGLYPQHDPSALSDLESLTVDVAYAPYHGTPFHAWSFSNGTTSRSSSPVALRVPVEEGSGLNLSITYKTAAMPAPETVPAHLALGGDRSTAKLREGVYVIALPGPDGKLPDWHAYRMLPGDGLTGCAVGSLYCNDTADLAPARHPHIMLSVE